MTKQAIIEKLPDWADDPMKWQTAMDIMEREISFTISSIYDDPNSKTRVKQIKDAWRIVSRGFAD
tara:strand:- start:1616 stop:1810 length:195 start_codon:yes stop_codon:yes gene_type:complete